MAGGVGDLMESGGVVFCRFRELRHKRQGDCITYGGVECHVLLAVYKTDAGTLYIVIDGIFCGFDGRGEGGRQRLVELGLDALAIVDMEDVEVFEDGNDIGLRIAFDVGNNIAVTVFLVGYDELPEYDELRLGALLYFAAFLLALFEGEVFAGLVQEHLIEQGVRPSVHVRHSPVIDASPRLVPRDDAFFEFCNDAVSDLLIDVHYDLSFLMRCAMRCSVHR